MPRELMCEKMARLKADVCPAVTLIAETNGRAVRLYSEKHHGACVTAESEQAALEKILPEINAVWQWGKGKPFAAACTPEIVERHTVDYPLDGIESDVIFNIERGVFNAVAYRVMRDMATRSALSLSQLLDSVPDPDADLSGAGGVMAAVGTAAEVRRITYFSTGLFLNKLGIDYENTGDIYFNRTNALVAARVDGFMRNETHVCDGEEWTLRKVLRRYIWQDRTLGNALYAAAHAVWGDRIAKPFA